MQSPPATVVPMKLHHTALALLISVVWGFTFSAAKAGVDSLPPLFFTGLRFLLVALLLAVVLRPLRGGRLKPVLGIALLVGVLHFTLIYLGIKLSGRVSTVSVAVQLSAPFSLLLAVVMLKEQVGWARWAGTGLAFLGVLVLGFDPVVFQALGGLSLVVLGAFVMSYGLILMRRLHGVGVLELQGWIALFSAPPLLLLSLSVESGQVSALANASWVVLGAIAYTALASSILGQGGWYYLLQRYQVSQVTPFGLLAPVWGVMFAVLLYGEVLSLRFITGSAITLVGVAIITLAGSAPTPRPAPALTQPVREQLTPR